MIQCGQCENENRAGARFCAFCGQPLPVEPAVPPEAGSPAAVAEDNEQPPAEPDPLPEERATIPVAYSNSEPEVIPTVEPPEDLSAAEQLAPDVLASLVGTLFPEREESATQAPDAEPVAGVLETGQVLSDRYRVIRPIAQESGVDLYEAEDLRRCWSCGEIQFDMEPRFCEMCGVELSQKPLVHLRAIPAGQPATDEGEWFTEGEIRYQVLLPARTELPERPLRVRLLAGYQSDTGKQREIDEDSLLVLHLAGLVEMRSAPALGFFAVADGIGGYSAGEVASRTAIRTLATSMMERVFIPHMRDDPLPEDELSAHLQQALLAANQDILTLRQAAAQDNQMGCTLTAVLVRDTTAIVANVGDSRTYLMRAGKLSQVTRDHSVIARLVEQGIISPEEARFHPQKGVIYRSLGDKPELEVETYPLTLAPGDRLLLCCDGLWEMVADPFVEDALLESFDPQYVCDRLVEQANLAGGEDNISVIVVNVQALEYAQRETAQ